MKRQHRKAKTCSVIIFSAAIVVLSLSTRVSNASDLVLNPPHAIQPSETIEATVFEGRWRGGPTILDGANSVITVKKREPCGYTLATEANKLMVVYPLKNYAKNNKFYAWTIELTDNAQEELVDLSRGRPIAVYVNENELRFEPIGNNLPLLCRRINDEGIKATYNLFHGAIEMEIDSEWSRLWKLLDEVHLEEKGNAGGRELHRMSAKYKRQP